MKTAAGFGWSVGEASFDWKKLIANKDREIDRLEGLYRKGLESAGAEIFNTRAELTVRTKSCWSMKAARSPPSAS
ncbi:MAG: hypothetical protein R3D29_07465 [Nitratireductor sp.]